MHVIFPAILLVIFFACVACLFTEGMWSNAIRLINVVTAALLATNLFEPLAAWLDGWQPSYTYVWDFLALWFLFGLFMVLFRLVTDFLSRVKVRFLKLADRIGSVILSMLVGWVMVCFTTMTLHTAPLARTSFGGGFVPEKDMLHYVAPDRIWLGFVQKLSQGAFSRPALPKDFRDEPAWQQEEPPTRTFDPRAEFLPKYATRRANLEAHMSKPTTKSLRVKS